ncbi:MAG: alanine:cation symporter family protein [Clostridiales bacterium]|nr:alanine:cation symporter family protein [Clostridiales bacterium]MDR2750068.1 alanine:cation symporter family protein [Clostridiales bacterium]
MLERIESINGAINGFVWGPVMLVLFLVVGLLFTVRTGFFQVTKFKLWMDSTFLAIFKHKHIRKTDDAHAISQFQSLCTALAATVGTGNIVGVATAIALGGPGSVFWMWLSAFLGMMTNYAENTLGIKYRFKNEKGEWVGGAMHYIERGLKLKWLAVVFSIFCMLASFGIGNMSQGNSIADGIQGAFFSGFSEVYLFGSVTVVKAIVALVIMVLVALVIIGGIKRIASVTEKIVPFMVLLYLIGGLIIIIANIGNIGAAFGLIFGEAFKGQSVAGGVTGYGIALAMRRGISRGVFSNEAGLGSSVMVHSASDVKEPVMQGMWGVFEVFADTIIVCSITALAILSSGVFSLEGHLEAVAKGNIPASMTGIGLTQQAFATVFGGFGAPFVSIAVLLFAFSTILGWSYYGERAWTYLFGNNSTTIYKVIFIAVIFFGCTSGLSLVWDISDTFNGLMAVPNLIAITLLSGQVVQMTNDFLKKRGKEN